MISQAFKYAIVIGDTYINPARDLSLVLKQPVNRHFAAPTSLEELKAVWQSIDVIKSISGTFIALWCRAFETAQ